MTEAKTDKSEPKQLRVPSESFRIKTMGRRLERLYEEWVEAGRPCVERAPRAT